MLLRCCGGAGLCCRRHSRQGLDSSRHFPRQLLPQTRQLLFGRRQVLSQLPLLQGCILVLAMFFVSLNLIVDVVQTAIDPRVGRS